DNHRVFSLPQLHQPSAIHTGFGLDVDRIRRFLREHRRCWDEQYLCWRAYRNVGFNEHLDFEDRSGILHAESDWYRAVLRIDNIADSYQPAGERPFVRTRNRKLRFAHGAYARQIVLMHRRFNPNGVQISDREKALRRLYLLS